MNRNDKLIEAIRGKNTSRILELFFNADCSRINSDFCTETELWDYKIKCPDIHSNHFEWAETAKDVLSFYNAGIGGVILYGINDTNYLIQGISPTEKLDNKIYNDKIRKYIGDRIWIEFIKHFNENRSLCIGIAVIPPALGNYEKFKQNGPEKNKRCLFYTNGSALRKKDSSYILSPKETNNFLLNRSSLTYRQYDIDEPNYRLLSRDYIEFIRREFYCNEIIKGLNHNRAAVVSLTGIGGVGKTALATWAIMDSYKNEKYSFIVSMTAKDRELTSTGIQAITQKLSTFDDLLNTILEVLGFPEYVSQPIGDKETTVRELLENESGLLFIDNLETIQDDEIIKFLNDLPNGIKAIVTSRRNLIRISSYPIDIGVLNNDEVIKFIDSISNTTMYSYCQSLTEAEKDKIGEACNKIPLAIKWMISRFNNIDELLSNIETMSTITLPNNELLEFSFRRIFDTMTNIEKSIIQTLALVSDIPLEAIVKGSGHEGNIILDPLDTLVRDTIVYQVFDKDISGYRYNVLPLIRTFIISHCINTTDEKKIRNRLTSWYEAADISDDDERIIMQAMRQGNKNAGDILITFADNSCKNGDFDSAIRFYEMAVQREPRNWKVYYRFAEYYRHYERSQAEALKYYQIALEYIDENHLEANTAVVVREFSILYSSSGASNATNISIEKLELVYGVLPRDPITAKVLSSLLINKGFYNRAIEILEAFKNTTVKKSREILLPLLVQAYEKHGGKMIELAELKAMMMS